MLPPWKELKKLSKSCRTIKLGYFLRDKDLKIKLSNEIRSQGIQVLPINPNTNGELCEMYLHHKEKHFGEYSINDDYSLDLFFVERNSNVGFDLDGWRYELIVVENIDKYQEFIVKKYKFDGGLYESL